MLAGQGACIKRRAARAPRPVSSLVRVCRIAALVVSALAAAGCTSWDPPQPDRVHYTVSQFRWRKADSDRSAERWSRFTKAVSGEGFLSLGQRANRGEIYGGHVDLDWRLGDDLYLNFRLGKAEKRKRHHIRSLALIPTAANIRLHGKQTAVELGLTREWEIGPDHDRDEPVLLFGTARIGYFRQANSGGGYALVGPVPLRIREDHNRSGLYGGLELGIRWPLSGLLADLGTTVNRNPALRVYLSTSVMTNHLQTAAMLGVMITARP